MPLGHTNNPTGRPVGSRNRRTNETFERLEENGQIVFRYCDEEGEITPESNPNGARSNIAGICNEDRNVLAQLPGFVPASDAVKHQSNKRTVLQEMENSHRDWLPVVSEEGQLDGIVERSRLIASMILDVTNQLQAPQPQSSPAASSSVTPE